MDVVTISPYYFEKELYKNIEFWGSGYALLLAVIEFQIP
jgi:hypothetical protein